MLVEVITVLSYDPLNFDFLTLISLVFALINYELHLGVGVALKKIDPCLYLGFTDKFQENAEFDIETRLEGVLSSSNCNESMSRKSIELRVFVSSIAFKSFLFMTNSL